MRSLTDGRCIAAMFACLACSAPQSNGSGAGTARSPETQSIAEYDIARDLWITRGRPREALSHVLIALELDDDNHEAAHLAALIHLDFCRRGNIDCRLDDAESHARRAIELKDDFREARNTLAVVLIHRRKLGEAIDVLTPLSEDILYKTPQNAWGNMGWAYLQQGRLELAVAALRRSIAANPDFCVGHYRLGVAYEKQREAEQSIAAYTRSLEAAGGQCQGLQAAYAGRARVLISLGRAEEARNDLQTCVRLDEDTDDGRQCSALQAEIAAP